MRHCAEKVETDPRFTNYPTWLSSDYTLDALGIKPNETNKRLGDGFYEQRRPRQPGPNRASGPRRSPVSLAAAPASPLAAASKVATPTAHPQRPLPAPSAITGNVTIRAGGLYTQRGSDVIAPGGDVDILAQDTRITEARETSASQSEHKSSQSGLSVGVSGPLISALQTIAAQSAAAGNTKDSRMQGLAAANSALAAKNAFDALKAGQGTEFAGKTGQKVSEDAAGNMTSRDATAAEQMGGMNLSISIGGSSSQSKQASQSDTARGSSIQAGGNVSIRSTGAGEASNVVIQGSTVKAGAAVTLDADNKVQLLAAQNTASQTSSDKSSSGSIGISIGTSGFGVTASASAGRGNADGSDVTHTNTRIEGNRVSIKSGGDTDIKGAVVKADAVTAKVGGNLNIESLQDTSTYRERSKSAGGSVTVGAGASGSFSASSSNIDSHYASVLEQSGIRAGDGGFQVEVQGKTNLIGGAITSTQAAIDQGRNEFESKGGVTTSDIENTARYSAKSTSIGIGTGMTGKNLGISGIGAGVGKDSGSASSTTQSAISGIAGNKDARTGDQESGIKPIFDQAKVQKEVEAQTAITQMFGREASKAIGDYAASQMKQAEALKQQASVETDPGRKAQLNAQAHQLESDWGDTGALRVVAHTLVGGLTGNAAGAAGAAVGTISAPVVASALNAAGVDGALASVITGIASTAAGAAVGGSAGGAAALNEVANNFLAHQENLARKQAVIDCAKGDAAACAQRDKLNALDKARDDALRAACQADGSSQACGQWIAYAKAAEATYGGTPDSASLRDELRFGIYSDAAERKEIQRLINSTPHAQPIGPQGQAALAALANIALDLTPVVGDIKGFAEAETPFDYTLALIGALGPAGDAAKALVKEAKALMEAGDTVSAVDKLVEAERSVAAIAGAKGNWSTVLNGKLEPSTVYKLDNGHAYVTDAAGRVKSVEGDLILGRMDRNTYQQCATGKCGEAGDEGGHLIAAVLGGAGDRINLILQSQLLNRGDWRSMEREFQNALKEGKNVNIKIELEYPSATGTRPAEFVVTAFVNGEKSVKRFTQ